MFGFANGLLLALLAAAVLDFALALWRQPAGIAHGFFPRCRRCLQWLWQNEHFLFDLVPGKGEALRTRAGSVLFFLGVAAYELNVAFCNSMARENWPWVQGVLAPALDFVLCAAMGAKILFGTRYTWKSMGTAGCLYFIVRWVYFNSQDVWLFGLFLVVFACKDVSLRTACTVYVAVGATVLALVAALHFGGIVSPGLVSERVGDYRLTMGYGHPNTFGGLLLGVVMAWVLTRAGRLRRFDPLLPAVAGVFLWVGPACRSAALACLGLSLALVLLFFFPRLFSAKPLAVCSAALIPLAALASYLLPMGLVKIGSWNNSFGPAWLARLDSIMTCRLSLTWIAYRYYGLPRIAGQDLMDWPPLDNSFAYSLFAYGPVFTLLWAGALAVAVFLLFRHCRPAEALVLIAMLFYAYMEMQFFHFTSNPAILLLGGLVFALPVCRWPGAALPAARRASQN